MKTFTSRSLIESRTVALLKGLTLFFLWASVVVLTTYWLSIDPSVNNAVQYIQKIVLTSNGTATGTTGIVLDGSGNAYFSGNVGIGTGTSSVALEVNGTGNFANVNVGYQTGGTNSMLNLYSTVSSFVWPSINLNNSPVSFSMSILLWGWFINLTGTSYNLLIQNRLWNISIATWWNVGIWTYTPSTKLEVSGWVLNINGPWWAPQLTLDSKWALYSAATETPDRMWVNWYYNNSGGNEDFTNLNLWAKRSIQFYLSWNGSTMTISWDKVGIWTDTPYTKLDVNGAIKIWNTTGACSSDSAGSIKFSGSVFYQCTGSARSSF